MHLEMSVSKILAHGRLWPVLLDYQNFIEMTSNMIYIVSLGIGFKCPRKIHLNTQCPPLNVLTFRRPWYTHTWQHSVLVQLRFLLQARAKSGWRFLLLYFIAWGMWCSKLLIPSIINSEEMGVGNCFFGAEVSLPIYVGLIDQLNCRLLVAH